ncbi:MAG TPA: PQQ-dependent dehydrogenase, methanol/ethanol family [Burkholderiaceae bacterium]|nr:PQQ-dependent dehydrogenase, methanol/ethanol family [Burkholderiaceae bacterium]
MKQRLLPFFFGVVLAALIGFVVAVFNVEVLEWRARVIYYKLRGHLPELPVKDFVRWLVPGSPVYLANLAINPNANAEIVNRLEESDAMERGALVYGRSCAHCHGETGRGQSGPDLVASVAGKSDWAFFSTVKWGRPGTAMSEQKISESEVWEVHAWLRRVGARAAAEKYGQKLGRFDVSPETLVHAQQHPSEWLTYAGTLSGHRHSALAQINPSNIQSLRMQWAAQLRGSDVSLEATPIVADGIMFVTESPEGVVALDAKTGSRLWHYQRPVPSSLPLCCGQPNRGVAVLGDTVVVATLDAKVVALDALTGRKRWEVKIAEWSEGYSITGAPLAFDDKVIVGVAGGGFGIRGAITALAVRDGRQLWRFHTVPGPGTPGHESWEGDSWKRGGAPPWATGSYDPELDLVYWGVGGPSPVYQRDLRPGDNLYSNSIVALHAKTGKLRWHYQFTPGDEHDWDAVQLPVLADIEWRGNKRPAVLQANRNGFFYALDRASGEFLYAQPFVKQTWNDGFDERGRPKIRRESRPSRNGTLVWPSVTGGTNWWPPSFDAKRGLVFVPAVDSASIFFHDDPDLERNGSKALGGTHQYAAGHPAAAMIKAVDTRDGSIRWSVDLERGIADVHRVVSGILSTDTGLVFAAHRDRFFALDADSGETLWQVRLGAPIKGPPITYAIDGRQHVAVIAGHALFTFALPTNERSPSATITASPTRACTSTC